MHKRERTVSRAYGGSRCANCVRARCVIASDRLTFVCLCVYLWPPFQRTPFTRDVLDWAREQGVCCWWESRARGRLPGAGRGVSGSGLPPLLL